MKRSGQPRNTAPRTDRKIRRLLEEKPFLSWTDIKRSVPELAELSVRTIHHHLGKDLKPPSRKPLKKPLLTPKMAKKSSNSATSTKVRPAKTGRKSCFRMNKLFYNLRAIILMSEDQLAHGQRTHVTFKLLSRPSFCYGLGVVFLSRPRWFLFFSKGQTMNATHYINVLDTYLLAFMNIHGCATFQQDSAPCHKAKAVTRRFQD